LFLPAEAWRRALHYKTAHATLVIRVVARPLRVVAVGKGMVAKGVAVVATVRAMLRAVLVAVVIRGRIAAIVKHNKATITGSGMMARG
jgi:hypothetical protein